MAHRLLLLSGVVAAAAQEHTLRSTTTEEVPTFYHLKEYKGLTCNGSAFTDDKIKGCNGWTGLSEHECKMKCAGGETPAYCPKRLCFALAYYEGGGGWCHLYNHSNCLSMVPYFYATTFKKEHDNTGGFLDSPAAKHINLGALALAASAAAVALAEITSRGKNVSAGALAKKTAEELEKMGDGAVSTTPAFPLGEAPPADAAPPAAEQLTGKAAVAEAPAEAAPAPAAAAATAKAAAAAAAEAAPAAVAAALPKLTQSVADTSATLEKIPMSTAAPAALSPGAHSKAAISFSVWIAALIFICFSGCAAWQALKKRRRAGASYDDPEEEEYFNRERGLATVDPELD